MNYTNKKSLPRPVIGVLLAAVFSGVMAVVFALIMKQKIFALIFVFFAITDLVLAIWLNSKLRRIEESKPNDF